MKEDKKEDIIYESVIISIIVISSLAIIYNIFLKNYFQIPECIIYKNFGIYCPGCGCTRAITSLFKLNIIESIKYNPTILYSVIMLDIYVITQTIFRIFKNKKIYTLKYNVIYIYIGIALLISTCIIKNIIKFIS